MEHIYFVTSQTVTIFEVFRRIFEVKVIDGIKWIIITLIIYVADPSIYVTMIRT